MLNIFVTNLVKIPTKTKISSNFLPANREKSLIENLNIFQIKQELHYELPHIINTCEYSHRNKQHQSIIKNN